jgi:hypothetical protein
MALRRYKPGMTIRVAFVMPCLLAGTSACLAADYPPRKPGLWEIRTGGPGAMSGSGSAAEKAAAQTIQQCIDAKSDQALRDMGMGMGKDMCSRQEMRNEGGTLVVDSVCTIGPTTATSHAVITGDMSSAYRMESTSTYKPPLMGKTEGKVTLEAKWVGPCKADQKPGDMFTPNGMKMNVLDMMVGMKKK